MANVSVWQKVAVAMQSALTTAQAITSISKANPAVLTYVGADTFTNGSYVLLQTIQGMSEVDGRVFRVANVNTAANTFELEGLDSTAFGTFTSGNVLQITFGTTFATLTGLSASGGDFDFIDTTTIHDIVKSQIPGAANPATYSFDSIWDVADAGLVAAKSASDNKAQRCFLVTFANSQKVVFNGYIATALLPGGSAQDKVTTSVTITMFGRPTVYST